MGLNSPFARSLVRTGLSPHRASGEIGYCFGDGNRVGSLRDILISLWCSAIEGREVSQTRGFTSVGGKGKEPEGGVS